MSSLGRNDFTSSFDRPDFSRHFVLHAFDKGFRTVLLYKDHPVAFLSKALSEQKKKKSYLNSCGNTCVAIITNFHGFYWGITKAQGKDIVVILNQLTAWDVAEIFLQEVVCLQGFQATIVSGQEEIILRYVWTGLFLWVVLTTKHGRNVE